MTGIAHFIIAMILYLLITNYIEGKKIVKVKKDSLGYITEFSIKDVSDP